MLNRWIKEAREFVLRIRIMFGQCIWGAYLNGRQMTTKKFTFFARRIGDFDLGDGLYGDAP